LISGSATDERRIAHLELARAQRLAQPQLVEVVIAPNQRGHRLAVGAVDEGFHETLRRNPEELRDLLDGGHARSGHALEGLLGLVFRVGRVRGGLGLIQAGPVVARRAHQHDVLAGISGLHELVGIGAAHGGGIGLDHQEGAAAALEDAAIGAVHLRIGAGEVGLVAMERVGVLHHELAAADEPAAGARLVAELGLDLVEHDGQLAVGLQGAAREVGDDLLVGGAQAEDALVAVGDADELGPPLLGAAAFAPQFLGVQGGQQEFLGAQGVHLLAHDRGDLAQHAPTQRQVGVDPRGQPPDEPAAHQQAVAY
jgi:hypothetical protein